MFEYMGVKLFWLGHDGFKIKDDKAIYIDPYRIKADEPADILLISHEHYDHCSIDDARKIASEKTTVVTTQACKDMLTRLKVKEIKVVKPGDKLAVQGVGIEAVPAYNINKFASPGRVFHPKEEGKVGFVITVKGVRIYHAGDTDNIPEMANIRADIALLPVSGTYVMTAEEAAEAAKTIKPKVAIPMHIESIVGTFDDARRFQNLVPSDVQVVILQREG